MGSFVGCCPTKEVGRPTTDQPPGSMYHERMHSELELFESKVATIRTRLLSHPIYENLRDQSCLRVFMKYHVFAVWDFMSLLKSLQRNLTCVETPWTPSHDTQVARFINEIVLAEETDEISAGTYISHFELYLKAMDEVGADVRPILSLLKLVKETRVDLRQADTEGGVWDFMATTFSLSAGPTHQAAAAFLFGREDIIPEMFSRILKEMNGYHSDEYKYFRIYLERHIEVDGQHHGPLARKILTELCGDDRTKWTEAAKAALCSIEARIRLWDFVNAELTKHMIPALL